MTTSLERFRKVAVSSITSIFMILFSCERPATNPLATCGGTKTSAPSRSDESCVVISIESVVRLVSENEPKLLGSLRVVNRCTRAMAVLAAPMITRRSDFIAWENSDSNVYALLQISANLPKVAGLDDRRESIHSLPTFVIVNAHQERRFPLGGAVPQLRGLDTRTAYFSRFCTVVAPVVDGTIPTATGFFLAANPESFPAPQAKCFPQRRSSSFVVCSDSFPLQSVVKRPATTGRP
jgi:hypothetical protein